MIVVDIEFTSLNFEGGLWQIGALEFENPQNTFLEEARLEEEDEVQQAALDVVGKIEGELRDKNKQSQKQMLEHFFKWVENIKIKNLVCEGLWDFGYLLSKTHKFNLKFPFHYRLFELHSISQTKYCQINKKFLIKDEHSDMGLHNTLKFCGILDERRIILIGGKVEKDGSPHNALEDAKLTAECFSRLIYGKNLLPEFAKFKIPKYLKNKEKKC